MSSSANSMKNKEMAAFLKKKGVTRTSGSCPWGCGHLVSNGGPALISHLGRCKGREPRKASY